MKLTPEILFADEALLVVNKPAGLLSLPDGYDLGKPHLRRVLEPVYKRLWIVHRLDKDTTGVIILARNSQAHRNLNQQFSDQQVDKKYHAVVCGIPQWNEKTVEAPLRTNVGRRKRTVVDHHQGKPAITEFKVLARYQEYALVEAKPKTGRTHQIRVHLYYLEFPVLADPLYGKNQITTMINRLALHAKSLTVKHPITGAKMQFKAQYPKDLDLSLMKIRQHKLGNTENSA